MREMKRLDKKVLNRLLRKLLGEKFIDFLVIDLPSARQVELFVKTTEEFIWGDIYGGEDPVYDYIESRGYTHISLIASKSIRGGIWE